MKKRAFLKTIKNFSLIPFFTPFVNYPLKNLKETLPQIFDEDDLWKTVRSHYKIKTEYINLESGYYNIIPQPTLNYFHKHIEKINYEGSFYMRNSLNENKLKVISRLADLFGCSKNELAITRNTTESLDLIISGYPWRKNDEAIFAEQDYGAMKSMFNQVASRFGVVNKVISVPNHPKNDQEIVDIYESKITSKTKLIMVCHMINITGQIMPVKKICMMAHSYGVEVMIDGAHCTGHFDFKISELECDFYGSSLHKWLATPLGSGLLYVNKNKIFKIWALLADDNTKNPNDITRLNHIGTHPVHTDLAINNSIDYLEWIGIKRKEKRMRFLQNYWTSKLRDVNNIIINTPKEFYRSCGIANVGVLTISPETLSKTLMEKYKIFTVAIDYANVKGCRVTPNIFTSTKELDEFVIAMKEIAMS
jgi:selenocysteine lyase/cysteine desulfurase